MSHRVRITAAGSFSLASSIGFLRGFAPLAYSHNGAGASTDSGDPVMRLAFGVEGRPVSAGVVVRQTSDGVVVADVEGVTASEIDEGRLDRQIARILSLDVDASSLPAAVEGDSDAAALVEKFSGLRPVCFNSPYEAAAWAVLSQRVQMAQAAAARLRIARALGTTHQVAGEEVVAFPRPEVLLASDGLAGLTPEVKVQRLRAVAQAALDGILDGERLRGMDPADALRRLTTIDGVGPFSAELILVRGAGYPDAFPRSEHRLHREMSAVYGVPEDDVDALEQIADRWRPFRSWVSFYYRNQAVEHGTR